MKSVNSEFMELSLEQQQLINSITDSFSPKKDAKKQLSKLLKLALYDPTDWFDKAEKEDILYYFNEIERLLDEAFRLSKAIKKLDKKNYKEAIRL